MLRAMTLHDLDDVVSINAVNVPEVGAATPDHLATLLEQSAIALVDIDADRVVGFCIVLAPGAAYDSLNYRWFEEHHPASLYLDRVAFEPGHVGRGLGTAMYGHVDRILRTEFTDADGLGLEVNVDPPNEASLAFHARLGFREVGRRTSHGIEVSLMHRPV